MREQRISIPELALIAGTRAMLGVGAGLLLSGRLGARERLTLGKILVAVGAISTIPLVVRRIAQARRLRGANSVAEA
jgi:hypothetical protein